MRRTGFVVPHTRTGPDLRCAVSHGRQPLPLLRSRVFRTLYTTDALRAAAFASSSIASCDTRDAYSFLSPIIFFRLLDPVWRYLPLCCLDVLMHSGNTMYYFWAYCKYKVLSCASWFKVVLVGLHNATTIMQNALLYMVVRED